MTMIKPIVDPFDQDTWPVLTELRSQLRDQIFDTDCDIERAKLERELVSIEDDINNGYQVQVPF